jgi:thimet oligopeptidase
MRRSVAPRRSAPRALPATIGGHSMTRIGWAATALLVFHPNSSPAAASAPAATPSAAAAAEAMAGGVVESGDLIMVRAPWDPDVQDRINALLRQGREALSAAAAKKQKASYEETFLAWDAMCGDIDTIGSRASWEFNTSPEQAVRDRNEKTEELVGKVTARLYTLRVPYQVLKRAFDRLGTRLVWDRKAYSKDVLRAFERNGVHLGGKAKERVKAIDQELIELGTRYAKVLKDREIEVPMTAEQARHVDKSSVRKDKDGKTGEQRLVLREDSFLEMMRRHPDREFRKACYVTYFNGTTDQIPELDRMRRLREEKARLVKGTTYAALELEDEGFSQKQVRATLEELRVRTEPRFEQTIADYLSLNGGQPPKSFDLAYLEEHAPTAGVDPEVLLQYFSPANVVKSIMGLARRLYGLDFRLRASDDKLRTEAYDVHDRTQAKIGTFALDLFPRPHKYSHAACWTIQGRARHHPGRLAEMGLVANLHEKELPGGGKGIILDEAQTVFHEFGHVLHGLLIFTEAIGGHGCPRSLVEVPSQVWESWVLDPKVLDEMAVHHATGKPLPPDLRNVLYKKALRFAARHVRTQTLYALFDLDFHEKTREDAQAIWDRLSASLYGPDFYPPRLPWYSRFGHLDGYGAKYWGYKFADLGKAQIYWYLVHRFRDMLSGTVGELMERELFVFGGLKKLPKVAREFTGIPLTALPYVLETLVEYPVLRARIEAAAARRVSYKDALEQAFRDLIAAPAAAAKPPRAPARTKRPGSPEPAAPVARRGKRGARR